MRGCGAQHRASPLAAARDQAPGSARSSTAAGRVVQRIERNQRRGRARAGPDAGGEHALRSSRRLARMGALPRWCSAPVRARNRAQPWMVPWLARPLEAGPPGHVRPRRLHGLHLEKPSLDAYPARSLCTGPMEPESILVKGAREHNLKGITLEIPKKSWWCSPASRSGKSSLRVRHPVRGKAQRRYVGVALRLRPAVPRADGEKPHYDVIRGLSPTISIEQEGGVQNPRPPWAPSPRPRLPARALRSGRQASTAPSAAGRVGKQSGSRSPRSCQAAGGDEA